MNSCDVISVLTLPCNVALANLAGLVLQSILSCVLIFLLKGIHLITYKHGDISGISHITTRGNAKTSIL